MFDIYMKVPEPVSLPSLQAWRSWRARHPLCKRVSVKVDWVRERLYYGAPTLTISLLGEQDEVLDSSSQTWEPTIERWLIEEAHAKSRELSGEAPRIALLLCEALRPVLRDVGATVYNSTLLLLLGETFFDAHPEELSIIRRLPYWKSRVDGAEAELTAAAIVSAIQSVGHRFFLLYAEDEVLVKSLLIRGMMVYLDARYRLDAPPELGLF